MKKVININFQGRVIPIEETAYDILQQYVDSLRKYFANEEGRDEIINDIEGRIAELFSERLKKGATCITDDDVNAVIAGMGRPADFEQADAEGTGPGASTASSSTFSGATPQPPYEPNYSYARGRGRLYRNADDKILGGVCSGLANYMGIDPVVMRILFVVFIGALFWVYIILWIIVPSQSAQSNITKRLYRSADDKVIGGVCGGLAAYFNISTWIPRLIFALPLIIGLISGPFNYWWGDWDIWWGPKMVTGSLSFTLFVTYIILWIAVPVAVTATEKLEMRGEKVDLNSIRDTVKEDLESFKSKAQNWGAEVKETAQKFGQQAKTYGQAAGTQARAFGSEAAPIARSAGSNIAQVIGILFKAFFLFIAGIIALSLFGVLMGLLFGGFVAFPFKDFVLEGFWQNTLAWSSLILFLGVPIIALIIWLIRRIVGVRSKNNYLGYMFGSLWTIGLISFIILAGMFTRNFKTGSEKQEELSITQPPTGKLFVDVEESNVRYYGGDWFGIEWDEEWPIYGINQDTLMLNTVRVNIVKSKDSLYHVHKISFSRGKNPAIARQLAEKISFNPSQRDSTLVLPKGFAISRNEKFRNQRVLIVIEVPVGKKIEMDRSIDSYEWFTVNFNRRRGWNVEWDDNWDNSYGWRSNVEYVMTQSGLERTNDPDVKVDTTRDRNFKANIEANGIRVKVEGNVDSERREYRYQERIEQRQPDKKDTTKPQEDISKSEEERKAPANDTSMEMVSPIYMLSRSAR
ncbi:MAG TPA: PspC domain-containing protein [Chitinophagaceae bacterium]